MKIFKEVKMMKQSMKIIGTLLITLLIFSNIAMAQEESAQEEKAAMDVVEMLFCQSVEDREPTGVDTVFANTVETVYCYTKIVNSTDEPTKISHVWYLDGEQKSKIDLTIKGKSWRTWSSKTIPESWTGNWSVEVVSADGQVLESNEFVVKSELENEAEPESKTKTETQPERKTETEKETDAKNQ
jgi:hypothetical protein